MTRPRQHRRGRPGSARPGQSPAAAGWVSARDMWMRTFRSHGPFNHRGAASDWKATPSLAQEATHEQTRQTRHARGDRGRGRRARRRHRVAQPSQRSRIIDPPRPGSPSPPATSPPSSPASWPSVLPSSSSSADSPAGPDPASSATSKLREPPCHLSPQAGLHSAHRDRAGRPSPSSAPSSPVPAALGGQAPTSWRRPSPLSRRTRSAADAPRPSLLRAI